MNRTERVQRQKAADYSKTYRERKKIRVDWCRYQIERWLRYHCRVLWVHLEAVDDENVTDADLETTQNHNQKIKELEGELTKLEGKGAYDHVRQLKGNNSELMHDPPPLPPAPRSNYENAPTSAKDYADAVASELRNILACCDHYDRSNS